MSEFFEHGLPQFDEMLLRCVGRIVPSNERLEWSRSWHAELSYVRHHLRTRKGTMIADLSIGLTRDALWLRTESWRRAFIGTATLCLGGLFGLSLLALLMGLALTGNWHSLDTYIGSHVARSLVAGTLVVFVSFATASRGHMAKNSKIGWIDNLNRQLFLTLKIVQVLLLAFLLSTDVSIPVFSQIPNTSDFFQILDFVLLALAGLRWALRDQELRCKQCLHLLTTPARVGRPTRNLLEWNGSEMNCKRGHGLLSVSEMETSWCEASRWIECRESH